MDKPWTKHYDAGVPIHVNYPAEPLFWFLRQAAKRFPARSCTIFNDLSISYMRMEQLSNRLAKRLVRLGVCKGDRVGLCMPNIPQFVLGFYAILKAGGVVVALNPMYKRSEMSFQLADAGVEMVLCHTGAVPVLREVEQGGIAMRRIITRVEDADFLAAELEGQYLSTKPDQVAGEISFLELLQFGDDEEYTEVEVTPDDPAVFQYSGGTTGTPKGAIGLHRNLVANTIQFRAWLAGMQDGQETV